MSSGGILLRQTCLVAALAGVAQEPEELSPQQEIEALIAKTNALESFHLVYDLETSGEGESVTGSMEVVYRGPDLGRVRFSLPDGDKDVWMVDGTLYFQVGDGWRSASYPDPLPASRILRQLFPKTDAPLGPGAFLSLSGRSATGAGALNVSFGWGANGRSHVLGWLEAMRRDGGLTRDGSSLLRNSGENQYRVSRETGMLERAVIVSGSSRVTLQLREARLDIDLDAELVTLPEAAKNAEPDPETVRKLEAFSSPGLLREAAFRHVERVLASSLRPWDDRARADWRTFLEALYGDLLSEQLQARLEEWRAYVGKTADWLRTRLEKDPAGEEREALAQKIDDARHVMEAELDAELGATVDALPPISNGAEVREELFDIEREVIRSLWDERLREPVLEAFDEEVAALLER